MNCKFLKQNYKNSTKTFIISNGVSIVKKEVENMVKQILNNCHETNSF